MSSFVLNSVFSKQEAVCQTVHSSVQYRPNLILIFYKYSPQNMVMRRIFGPRRDAVTGEWRRLHNEELNDLYSSPNIVRVIKSRRMRWAGHVARMSKEMGVFRVLVGKPEGRRPLGRPRRRRVDNNRMDLQEVGIWTGFG